MTLKTVVATGTGNPPTLMVDDADTNALGNWYIAAAGDLDGTGAPPAWEGTTHAGFADAIVDGGNGIWTVQTNPVAHGIPFVSGRNDNEDILGAVPSGAGGAYEIRNMRGGIATDTRFHVMIVVPVA